MAGPIACRLKLIQRKYTQQSAKKGKNIAKKRENTLQKMMPAVKLFAQFYLKKVFLKLANLNCTFFPDF